MNKKDLVMLIMAKKTLDYQKDPDPENWRTIKGAHVHVDNEGKIDGGAGGKFNGKGALPRSLFPGQGKAKQTEFAEVTAKRKETEEAAKKAAAEAKERHKKELAEAKKAKREKERELEKKRPELKQKFNDLRESYHKETDVKKKKAIIKQLKEIESEYKDKFGKHPDDDNIKLPEKKPEAKNGKSDVGENGLAYLRSISHVNSSAEEETGYTARTMIDMINKGKTLEEIRTELRKNIDKYSHDVDNDYQHVDKMIEAVKRADKGEAKEPKMGATKSAENKDVRVKLSNGVTLRWQEVPGEPDKVYNPETREMYDFKGGLKAAIERAKSQGATVEEYEKEKYDPYQAESKNRQDRRLARSASAQRRAGRGGRPTGAR